MYSSYNTSYFGVFLNGSAHNTNGFIVDNIDLYYQPTEIPSIVAVIFLMGSAIVVVGEYVLLKVLGLIKSEKGIANEVCRVYILALMILGPHSLIFRTITNLVYPVHEVIGHWFCTFGWLFMYVCFNIVAFHSFVVAMMRYFFIVWREKAERYGKEKVKKIFFVLSLVVPLILTVWMAIDTSEIDAMSFVNKCYGIYDKEFLIEESTLDGSKRKFCAYEPYDGGGYYGKMIIPLVRQISCMIRSGIGFILYFNFTEGVLYYKTFNHIIR